MSGFMSLAEELAQFSRDSMAKELEEMTREAALSDTMEEQSSAVTPEEAIDRLIESASLPSLSDLVEAGMKSGLIGPQRNYV